MENKITIPLKRYEELLNKEFFANSILFGEDEIGTKEFEIICCNAITSYKKTEEDREIMYNGRKNDKSF